MVAKKSPEETKAGLKKRAIEACADRKGRVTPDAVIEAAKNPKSILHKEFEWDVDKAAHAHWTDTARRLIREVRLIVQYDDVKIVAPYYIADAGTDESAYVPTSKVADRHAAAQRALVDELARIKGAIHRATSLAAVFGLTSNFERMLDLAIETERTFSASEEIAPTTQPQLAQ